MQVVARGTWQSVALSAHGSSLPVKLGRGRCMATAKVLHPVFGALGKAASLVGRKSGIKAVSIKAVRGCYTSTLKVPHVYKLD
jgi:hypothetical protein